MAISLNNLAMVYFYLKKYEEALPLWQRAIIITEKALGAEHPNINEFKNCVTICEETIRNNK